MVSTLVDALSLYETGIYLRINVFYPVDSEMNLG